MRALIVHFSVTGTTRKVAASIAAGLEAAGAEVALLELPTETPPDVSAFDLIGIGFPVHWYRMPTPVRDAIRSLGDLRGVNAFVFALYGTYRGAGLNRARAALQRAGAQEAGVFSCHGEGRFLGYLRLGHQFSTGHPDVADLDAAFRFGSGLARAAGPGDADTPAPRDPPTHWVYMLERAAATPWVIRHVYARFFRADASRCKRCGRCAMACPIHNIQWTKGERPQWGRDCIMCMNCVIACPEGAVQCPMDWPVFVPFLRYNIRRASRDPDLAHARVELQRGRVVPVETPRT